MNIIDLTYDYVSGLKGPSVNHPTVKIERMAHWEEKGFNTTSILVGSHLGTHMDAAFHFNPNGFTIEETDLTRCIGDVTIIDARSIGVRALTAADLQDVELKERVIVRFGWSKYWNTDKFNDVWPTISEEAARYMAGKGVKLIAVDTISPDPKNQGPGTSHFHEYWLGQQLIIIENLNIPDELRLDGEYMFYALPLRIKGADGSPCRAILIEK